MYYDVHLCFSYKTCLKLVIKLCIFGEVLFNKAKYICHCYDVCLTSLPTAVTAFLVFQSIASGRLSGSGAGEGEGESE